MQNHLIKNAIINIPAMSFLAWSWVQIRYKKQTKWIYTYPILLLFWLHFHGSVMVGACVLSAIWFGEMLDSVLIPALGKINPKNLKAFFKSNLQYVLYTVMLLLVIYSLWFLLLPLLFAITYVTSSYTKTFFEHFEKEKTQGSFIIAFSVVVFATSAFVHRTYPLPFLTPINPILQTVGILPKPETPVKAAPVAVSNKKADSADDSQSKRFFNNLKLIFDDAIPLKSRLKNFFRIVFGGTDAQLVAEYQWPFEILYVLSVKALFLFVVIYICYLLFRFSIGLHDLKLSFELPSIALIYLSLGYLRTMSYPFVTAMLFMAFSVYNGYAWMQMGHRTRKGWILLGLNFLLVILWATAPLFSEFVNLFFNALKDGNMAKDARFIAIPLLFLPLCFGLLMIQKKSENLTLGLNILLPAVGVYILACLLYFAYYENKTYLDGDFHTVTGFLDTEPGWGKSNKFFEGMANLVETELPPKNIYNSYNMGGYLLWKWYGKRKVFIDGRSIIYEGKFYQAYTTNNAQEYIQKEDLEHAILNMVVDKDRILIFSRQGWYPIHFDGGMTILKKPKTYEEPFGVLPKYHDGERPIKDVENLDRLALAEFINTTVHHMMLYGRIKDAHEFMSNSKDIIEQIPEAKQKLYERHNHIKLIGENFGFHNHQAMAALTQKIFNKVQGFDYNYAMGEAHLALQQYQKAEGQFGQAFNLKKTDINVLKRMGEVLYLQKKYQNAASFFAEALKQNEKDPVVNNLLMLTLIEMKQYDQAIAYGQRAIQNNPNFAEAYFNMGRVLLLKNDANQALTFFNKSLQLKPNFPEAKAVIDQIAAEKAKPSNPAQAAPVPSTPKTEPEAAK